jgi:predicted dehydrogenase
MKKVKVGIVGLGLAGYQLHLPAYASIEQAEIHSLCTRNETTLQQAGKQYNVSNLYSEYDDFLNDPELEAVSICVTDPLHYEYARKALETEKHILCEKPLVTTLEDARGLVALSKKHPTIFAVGQVYRFVPQFVIMKKILTTNRIGELFHIDCDYQQDMRELYKMTPWRRDDKTWNSWIAGGSHVIDLVRWIAGDIEEIMMYANKGEEDPEYGPIDDNHLTIMKFANGSTGKVWEVRCVKRAPEFSIKLGIFGSRGTSLGQFENNTIKYFSLENGEDQEDFSTINAHKFNGIPVQYELEDFISSIINDHAPRCDIISGAKTIASLLAGEEAKKRGSPVKVPSVE